MKTIYGLWKAYAAGWHSVLIFCSLLNSLTSGICEQKMVYKVENEFFHIIYWYLTLVCVHVQCVDMKIHRYMDAYLNEGSFWTSVLMLGCNSAVELCSRAMGGQNQHLKWTMKPLTMESMSRCHNMAPGRGASIWLPLMFLIPHTELVNQVLSAVQHCGRFWNCTVTNRAAFKKRCILGCYLLIKCKVSNGYQSHVLVFTELFH